MNLDLSDWVMRRCIREQRQADETEQRPQTPQGTTVLPNADPIQKASINSTSNLEHHDLVEFEKCIYFSYRAGQVPSANSELESMLSGVIFYPLYCHLFHPRG